MEASSLQVVLGILLHLFFFLSSGALNTLWMHNDVLTRRDSFSIRIYSTHTQGKGKTQCMHMWEPPWTGVCVLGDNKVCECGWGGGLGSFTRRGLLRAEWKKTKSKNQDSGFIWINCIWSMSLIYIFNCNESEGGNLLVYSDYAT